MASEIFISYRRADQDKARLLHVLLKQRGIDAWYDALLDAGADWRHSTAEALERAPIFVLLFSKVASESDDISKELAAATFSRKTIVPVRLENIKPSGAFLYELASRNWFDAFDETEMRFEELADKLATLVRGGPDADVAALGLGSSGAPARTPTAKPLLKQPLVLGGLLAVAVALVAVAGFAMMGPKPGAAEEGRRAAFFGFTTTDDDPLSGEVARVATDETYATLTAIGLETAARGDTEGVALKDQVSRATELGARYVVAGNVRTSGDLITVTMRLDDAQTRATLWQKPLAGVKRQSESLPVRAAAKITNVLLCLTQVRQGMQREDASALGAVALACESDDFFDPQTLARWRAVVAVAPGSAVAHSVTGMNWILQSAAAKPDDRRTMLKEARQSFERARSIDPNMVDIRAGMDMADLASERSLAAIVDDLSTILGVDADRRHGRSIANVALIRVALLSAMGRSAEAARLGRADVATDPLSAPLQSLYASALYAQGQIAEARRLHESVNRRLADHANWSELALLAIFEGYDFRSVETGAPLSLPPETVDCWRQAAKAARASDNKIRIAVAQRMQLCGGSGIMQTAALGVMARLGDLDDVFRVLEGGLDRSNPLVLIVYGRVLFLPHLEALRAHPRFLPLVKKAGIYQYWLDANTPPDICATPDEREIELCRELRKDMAAR